MLVTRDFVLVHVPKTGGKFLRACVEDNCELIDASLPFHAPYSALPADYQGLPAVAFVRNPFEWYVSWYEHYQHFGPDTPGDWAFNRFWLAERDFSLTLELCFKKRPDYYSSVIQDMTTGCDVRRFERLREDFIAFLQDHGIDNPGLVEAVSSLPPRNVGSGHAPLWDYYSEEEAELVADSWVARTYGYGHNPPPVELIPEMLD